MTSSSVLVASIGDQRSVTSERPDRESIYTRRDGADVLVEDVLTGVAST